MKTTVMASGIACPDCGSTLVRISTAGDTCEGCRRNKRRDAEQKRKERADQEFFRRSAMSVALAKLINMHAINIQALNRHRRSLNANSGASPAVQKIISGKIHRSERFVEIIEEAFEVRLSHGFTVARNAGSEREVADRRKLLASVASGHLRIPDLLADDSRREVLSRTHGFALVRAQHGHQAAVQAFRRLGVAVTIPCTKTRQEEILAIHHTISSAPRNTLSGVSFADSKKARKPNPRELEQRRNSSRNGLLDRLQHGRLSLPQAMISKSSMRTLASVGIHELIDLLIEDHELANDIKIKMGGTSARKFGDLSNLERTRLTRIVEAATSGSQ